VLSALLSIKFLQLKYLQQQTTQPLMSVLHVFYTTSWVPAKPPVYLVYCLQQSFSPEKIEDLSLMAAGS